MIKGDRGGIANSSSNNMKKPGKKYDTDMKALKRICRIDFYTGSGKGGQHRNRHYTCVRLHHPYSGITVLATEHRSQSRNRRLAFKRLVERLNEMNRDETERIPTSVPRSVKLKSRVNKIRHSLKKRLRRRIDHGSSNEE